MLIRVLMFCLSLSFLRHLKAVYTFTLPVLSLRLTAVLQQNMVVKQQQTVLKHQVWL